MEPLLQDLRFALRTFRTSPGFVLIAVLTLALGIGSNAAMFSVVKTVLLRPLGIRDPQRVVMLWPRNLSRSIPVGLASPARYDDWRNENHVFSEMAAATDAVYTFTGSGDPQDLVAWRLSANFFHLLGAQPFLGTGFTPENEQLGHHQVIVLSYRIWQSKFGSDSNIVGRSITLNDQPFTILGVMPHDFSFPSDVTDVWTPLVIPANIANSRTATPLRVAARLRDGVTIKQAQAEMSNLSAVLAKRHPDTEQGWDVQLVGVRENLVGDAQAPLLALTAAVGFLLLIACVNTAQLLLARAATRTHEIAVRVALGASRWRIARQVLTEGLLLGLISGGAGLLLAHWEAVALVSLFPKNVTNLSIPLVTNIPIDGPAVLFCIALSLLTTVLFATVPAVHSAGVHPIAALKSASGGASRTNRRTRSVLVGVQLGIAFVLLVCAGLMIKSFVRLQNTSLGFNPDHVLTLQAFLSRSHYKTDPERSRFVNEVVRRIEQLPGVESAGAVNFLPLSTFSGRLAFQVPGLAGGPVSQWPEAGYRIATENYFRTMQIPLLRGRVFNSTDTPQSEPVCVVNETFARKFFAGQDPVGKLLTANPEIFGSKPFVIVGVVGNVKHFGAAEEPDAEVYRPFTQDGFPLIALVVRTRPEALSLADSVRKTVWSVDSQQSIFRVMTMEDAAADSVVIRRVSMIIFVFFSAVALFLSVIGVYGVVSYLVAQQTREIGIRIALGAQVSAVITMIVGYSVRVALIALAVGVPVAFAVAHLLRTLLYQVRVSDPIVFVTVPVLLCGVAALASWVPALRASRVQPLDALRAE